MFIVIYICNKEFILQEYIKRYIEDAVNTKKRILNDDKLLSLVEQAAQIIIKAYQNGNKVLIAGNGGSAADAQHIAGELVSKFFKNRKPLNAIALTTNMSVLTAIGNDYSHEYVFERQIDAYACEGDVFIAISTSGNSKNIIRAINEAKSKNMTVVGLCGGAECEMDNICDCLLKVPSKITPIIQEAQIMIGHAICAVVEDTLF